MVELSAFGKVATIFRNITNDAPVASAVSASTNEDTAKAITLSATDAQNNNLTYSIVSNPSNGSLGNVSGTSVTYTPNANWNGTDTFTYKANDGPADSNTATVTVTVAAVEDLPVSSAVSASTNEDTAKAITLSATDGDGDSLTYSIVSNPSNGSLGNVSGAGVTYTPNANWNGTDTFTYKANDGKADSNTSTVTLTVAAVNDIPTAADVTLNLSYESDRTYSIDMTSGASDVEGSNLTYQMLSTDNLNGSYSHDGSSGTGTFTSSANFTGSAGYITYRASDGTDWSHSNTSGGKIYINIDAPGIKALSFDGSNDKITLSPVDLSSGDKITVSGWIKPDSGALNSTSAWLRQQPSGGNPTIMMQIGGKHSIGLSTDDGYNELDIDGINSGDYEGGWHFMVMTYDGTTKRFYRDGAQIGSNTSNSGDISYSASGGLYIGSSGSSEYFDGKIDEIAIWNDALTASEITALYNSGYGLDASSNSGNYTSSSNLKGYWKMNEQTGNTVADSSTNSNSGTISGASWSEE